MSYKGKQIEVLDKDNKIVKTITVKSEKDVNGMLVVTDEEGNLYTEEELNLCFVLTPEGIMYTVLCEHDLIDGNDFVLAKDIVKEFMEGMVNAGYIVKKDE